MLYKISSGVLLNIKSSSSVENTLCGSAKEQYKVFYCIVHIKGVRGNDQILSCSYDVFSKILQDHNNPKHMK